MQIVTPDRRRIPEYSEQVGGGLRRPRKGDRRPCERSRFLGRSTDEVTPCEEGINPLVALGKGSTNSSMLMSTTCVFALDLQTALIRSPSWATRVERTRHPRRTDGRRKGKRPPRRIVLSNPACSSLSSRLSPVAWSIMARRRWTPAWRGCDQALRLVPVAASSSWVPSLRWTCGLALCVLDIEDGRYQQGCKLGLIGIGTSNYTRL